MNRFDDVGKFSKGVLVISGREGFSGFFNKVFLFFDSLGGFFKIFGGSFEEPVGDFEALVISLDISIFSSVLSVLKVGVDSGGDIGVFRQFFLEFLGFLDGVFWGGIVFHVFFYFSLDSVDSRFFSIDDSLFRGEHISQGVDGIDSTGFVSVFEGGSNVSFGDLNKFDLGIKLGGLVDGVHGFAGVLFVSSIDSVFGGQNGGFKLVGGGLLNITSGAGFRGSVLVILLCLQFVGAGFS